MAAHRSRRHDGNAPAHPRIAWCCPMRCRRPSQPRCWRSRRSRGVRARRRDCSRREATLGRWCPGRLRCWQQTTWRGTSGSRRRGRCGATGAVEGGARLAQGSGSRPHVSWASARVQGLVAGLLLHTRVDPAAAIGCCPPPPRCPPQEQLKQQHLRRLHQRYILPYDHEQPLPGAPWAVFLHERCWALPVDARAAAAGGQRPPWVCCCLQGYPLSCPRRATPSLLPQTRVRRPWRQAACWAPAPASG